METKIAIGQAVSIGDLKLVPIVKTSVSHWRGWFFVTKQPVSILAISSSRRVAFAMTGESTPAEQLAERYPELKPDIERL